MGVSGVRWVTSHINAKCAPVCEEWTKVCSTAITCLRQPVVALNTGNKGVMMLDTGTQTSVDIGHRMCEGDST